MKCGILIRIGDRDVDLTDARYDELMFWLGTLTTKQRNMAIRRLVHLVRGCDHES